MTKRSLELFIDDIIEAINKIERYTKDMDFSEFKNNELVVDAVIRNLEVIGEASTHLPANIKENVQFIGRYAEITNMCGKEAKICVYNHRRN